MCAQICAAPARPRRAPISSSGAAVLVCVGLENELRVAQIVGPRARRRASSSVVLARRKDARVTRVSRRYVRLAARAADLSRKGTLTLPSPDEAKRLPAFN
jgi:hypothetical protein